MVLEDFLKSLDKIGGIERCGQPGFCMLLVLWQKSIELQSLEFSMSKTELYFKAGFQSKRSFYNVRQDLQQKGFFNFQKIQGEKSVSLYKLNLNFLNVATENDIKNVPASVTENRPYEGLNERMTNSSTNRGTITATNGDTQRDTIHAADNINGTDFSIETQNVSKNSTQRIPENEPHSVPTYDTQEETQNDTSKSTKKDNREDLVVELFAQYSHK
jgi:hypothetical protein